MVKIFAVTAANYFDLFFGATFYLFLHIAEKSYFDFELDIWQIYAIATINLLVSGYFTYKGISIFLKSAK